MISKILLLKEAFFYLISKIIPGIAGLVSVIFFIRIIGPEEYGNFSYLLSQCYLVAAIGFGWLNQANLRYFSHDGDLTNYNISQIVALLFSVLVSFILLAQLIFFQSSSIKNTVILFIIVVSIGLFNYIKTLFQAKLLPSKVIFITSLQSVMSLLIPIILLWVYKKNGNIILLGVGLSFLFSAFFILINKVFKNSITLDNLNFSIINIKIIKKWFYYGGPLSLWFAAGLSLSFLDRFFINHYMSSNDLGIYASSQELLTKFFSFTIFPLTLAMHPRIMSYWNKSKKSEVIDIIKWGLGIIFCIPVFLFFLFWISDNIVFNIMSKLIPQFDLQYKPIIIPLLSAGFLWQLSFITHKIIELKEQTLVMVFFIFISLMINIFCNSYYLPRFGLIATANIAFFSALAYCLLTGIYSIFIIAKSNRS